MTELDEVIAHNNRWADQRTAADRPAPPARRLAVLTCMDARIDPAAAFGLAEGDAHVIRNAGGAASEDALRSLVVSQRLLGTREIAVVHHTRCGMQGLDEAPLKESLEAETGVRPSWAFDGFADLDADVRQTVARLRACPWLDTTAARGFVYQVDDGRLREVDL